MSVPPGMSDVELPTRPTTRSPLLSRPGAVAGEGLDAGVALHYGDPMREQRLLEEGLAVVDLSHRDVVTVTGPDRLSWLHSLTTQHLLGLEPRAVARGPGPDAQGPRRARAAPRRRRRRRRGSPTEPGAGPALVDWLDSMRFMLRVEVADVTDDWAVLGEPHASESVDGRAPGLARPVARPRRRHRGIRPGRRAPRHRAGAGAR